MSTRLDMIAKRLKPKPAVDADLAAVIEQAVAQALAGHPDTPMPAPQSARVRALLRDMQTPAPVARKPSAPVPAPVPTHAQDFVNNVSIPRHARDFTPGHEYLPANEPTPSLSTPSVITYTQRISDRTGRVAGWRIAPFEMRNVETGRTVSSLPSATEVNVTARDANGRILETVANNGVRTRVTERDGNGKIAAYLTILPPRR